MKTSVFRQENFCATHRLHNHRWSDEKNALVFGKCNNADYHGHNYKLVVKITGETDPDTGYVIDAKLLKTIIEEQVINRYDHRNLFTDVEDFSDLNPTSENIAAVIYSNIRKSVNPKFDIQIRLYETDKIWVEYPAI